MADRECRGAKRHCQSPKPPASFYRIIFPSTIDSKKLRLPEMFSEKYGDELSPIITLTTPKGGGWHMGLEKADEMLWFNDGWQTFMAYHSITYWYFLIFKYQGNSNFDVLIFDKSGVEINYPCTFIDSDESHEKFDNDDSSIEFLGSSLVEELMEQRSQGKKVDKGEGITKSNNVDEGKIFKNQIPNSSFLDKTNSEERLNPLDREHGCYLTRSKTKEMEMNQGGNDSLEGQEFQDCCYLTRSKRKEIEKREEQTALTPINTRRALTMRLRQTQDKERADHSMFQPENPFFEVVFSSSNVRYNYFLYIPTHIARKYLLGVPNVIKLEVSGNGNKWPIHCIFRDGVLSQFSKGWLKFVRENHLVIGDVCVFDLLVAKDGVMKVSIIRNAEGVEQGNRYPEGKK